MRITYDGSADAVMIYLKDKIEPGESVKTDVTQSGFILDFDKEGRLIGIEVLSASRRLPKEVIASAEIIG